MPHPAKKSRRTKAAKRASRVTQRKKDKREFEHLKYLESQLDENGVPIDILNTDYKLLNNEQKLIAGIIKMLSYIDLRSIALYVNEHLNEEDISNIITNYYANKENKTWADSFFQVTYNCFGILNLNHFFIDKVLDETDYIIDNIEQSDKPVMTDEIFENIVNEFRKDLQNLNLNELINTTLLVYSQNQDHCMIGGKKSGMKHIMNGGYTGIPFFDAFIMMTEGLMNVSSAVSNLLSSVVSGISSIMPLVAVGFIGIIIINIFGYMGEKKIKEEETSCPKCEEKKRRADEIIQKEEAAKAEAAKAAEARAIDEQRLILKALANGHSGNKQELIDLGRLQETHEKIEEKKQLEMRLRAEAEAEELRLKQRKWWQRLKPF